MGRELKFRAWEAKSKTMVDWFCMNQTAFNNINILDEYESIRSVYEGKDTIERCVQRALIYGDHIKQSFLYKIFHNPDLVLMQFTGLLDKNGKEIFEGDILKLEYDWGEDEVTQVYFKDGMMLVDADFGECDTMPLGYAVQDFEAGSVKYSVVGNIHEHPELLK